MDSDGVLAVVDEGGRVIEWARPAEELFGLSAEEAVGRSVAVLMAEVAADGKWERASDVASVLVKPTLRRSSIVWQVLAPGPTPSRQDVAILNAAFTQSSVGLFVLDDRLRVLRVHAAEGVLRDTPAESLLGRRFTEVCELEDREEEAAVARMVLESGEPVVNRTVRSFGTGYGPRRRRAYSVSYFRLEDSEGGVLGLVLSVVDVTVQEQARRRLAIMDTVRARVGHRLNVVSVCQELVAAVVPAFAGIAVVEVIEDVVCGEEPPQAPVDQDVPLRRAAFRGLVSAHPVGDVRPLPAGTPFSGVLSDLRPRLVSIAEDSSWLAADPARADAIERSDAHSLIVAPLALRDGQALGVVSFYRHRKEDPFDAYDVGLASAVCAHAALCIDNARQNMREWITASIAQRRLLPQPAATPTTVDISHQQLPGSEGAAWSDAFALPGARTALIVSDVAGTGIIAAVTSGLLRTAIHALAALDLQPDELLARLSDTAARLAAERAALPPEDPLRGEPLTAGCTIAIYDPVELTCTIARADLPAPAAALPDGAWVVLSVPPGPRLAAADKSPFPVTTVDLPAGSILAMSTAALTDMVLASTGPMIPLADETAARPLPDLCDSIAHALTGDHRTRETLLLLARTKALPADRVLTRSLPADPEAAPIARAATRHQLEMWGVTEETAFTTELIVSELVGNAVRYGAPPLQLRLIFEHMLTVEVSDAAPGGPHVKHARTIDETGRGCFIVASLADQWGTRYHARGKTVWAVQAIGARPESVSPRRPERAPASRVPPTPRSWSPAGPAATRGVPSDPPGA